MESGRVKLSGYMVLFIGVALLLFTFANAYQLLVGVTEIGAPPDLMDLFGEALAPLIIYAIRALYLGIMGWIGSILSRRGIQALTTTPREGGKGTETGLKPRVRPEGESEKDERAGES